jgi:hypothetical protein
MTIIKCDGLQNSTGRNWIYTFRHGLISDHHYSIDKFEMKDASLEDLFVKLKG